MIAVNQTELEMIAVRVRGGPYRIVTVTVIANVKILSIVIASVLTITGIVNVNVHRFVIRILVPMVIVIAIVLGNKNEKYPAYKFIHKVQRIF
jgi:hypothetical protein